VGSPYGVETAGQERAIREVAAPYVATPEATLSLPYPLVALLSQGLDASVSPETIVTVLSDLCQADIANLTPVQALVLLNELQRRLRGYDARRETEE
jgi:hypothetical protein